jgi:hypothetical protein
MRMLFLDDMRVPSDVKWVRLYEGEYDIVRSYAEFCDYIERFGIPDVISFDNDLGPGVLEGYHCAQWLVERFIYLDYTLPEDFRFTVHSMNPIAADRIKSLLFNALSVYHER